MKILAPTYCVSFSLLISIPFLSLSLFSFPIFLLSLFPPFFLFQSLSPLSSLLSLPRFPSSFFLFFFTSIFLSFYRRSNMTKIFPCPCSFSSALLSPPRSEISYQEVGRHHLLCGETRYAYARDASGRIPWVPR